MTDDTIELIAKAIHEATTARFEGCRPWWNDLCEDDKFLCREQARAALSAMPQQEVTVKDAAKVLLDAGIEKKLAKSPAFFLHFYAWEGYKQGVQEYTAILSALSGQDAEGET